jgi:hypothetical protein
MGVNQRVEPAPQKVLVVDNLLKTVDKPFNLGKTRPFVRIIRLSSTPIYRGDFLIRSIP